LYILKLNISLILQFVTQSTGHVWQSARKIARNSKISIQCSSSGIEMAQRWKKYFSNAVEACRKTRLQSRRFKNIHGMGKAFRLVFTQNVMFPRKSWLLENIDISKILTVRNQSPKNWFVEIHLHILGRYREGIDKPEPIVWKTRLRCALNKMPDIRELPEMSRLDISDPYRVYELLPPMHKGMSHWCDSQIK